MVHWVSNRREAFPTKKSHLELLKYLLPKNVQLGSTDMRAASTDACCGFGMRQPHSTPSPFPPPAAAAAALALAADSVCFSGGMRNFLVIVILVAILAVLVFLVIYT